MINFYVSPNGSDSSDGVTPASPFQSIQKAVEAVRNAKKAANQFSGATVNIMTGIYHIHESVIFDLEDSGSENAPVNYRAYNGQVRICGGVFLKNPKPVTDDQILLRLAPSVRDKIIQYDLKSEGINNIGNLSERGFAKPIRVSHIELYFNDIPMTPARYPDTDEFVTIRGPKTECHADGFYYDIYPLRGQA